MTTQKVNILSDNLKHVLSKIAAKVNKARITLRCLQKVLVFKSSRWFDFTFDFTVDQTAFQVEDVFEFVWVLQL